jgi:hypothetical protein
MHGSFLLVFVFNSEAENIFFQISSDFQGTTSRYILENKTLHLSYT